MQKLVAYRYFVFFMLDVAETSSYILIKHCIFCWLMADGSIKDRPKSYLFSSDAANIPTAVPEGDDMVVQEDYTGMLTF